MLKLISNILGNAGVVHPSKLQADYGKLLTEGEVIEVGFSVFRDTFVFTNKRLILVDVQGLTGKKIEYLTIPYTRVTSFSVETAGSFDLDAELKIWVGSNPTPVSKKFNKQVNIYDLQAVLARHVLEKSPSGSVPVVPAGVAPSSAPAVPNQQDEHLASTMLAQARDLAQAGDKARAIDRLKAIVRQYPLTTAAEKARRSLASHGIAPEG